MSSKRERGFTLVELLVSLAILAVALGVLFSAISGSLDRVRKGRNDALAGALVQSLLARSGTERPLAAGETSGAYSNGYRWQVVVEASGDSDDAKARRASAFAVRASVSWQEGEITRTKALHALRIVPLPPPPP